MPEIESECTFEIAPGNVLLKTQVNGDEVLIKHCHFTADQAASFAWLVNNKDIERLEITIKEKV